MALFDVFKGKKKEEVAFPEPVPAFPQVESAQTFPDIRAPERRPMAPTQPVQTQPSPSLTLTPEQIPKLPPGVPEELIPRPRFSRPELPPPPQPRESYEEPKYLPTPPEPIVPPRVRPRPMEMERAPETRERHVERSYKPFMYVRVSRYREVVDSIDRVRETISELKRCLDGMARAAEEENRKISECEEITRRIDEITRFFERIFTQPEE
ncbi:MAG: hypothetical protein OH319_00965 [Candidatus Parvarchaeota archaeon]|nr:hypothetical protein [Candidatus Jingweiarchaeum tengchongense]MCW1297855.1 hypothetical protein [Candidatus Jingweiarchaeum tengchongense]MCW1299866.1 hypothetical protein [Candidatus Jingweiarchaeum tengchongense]MCW1304164.1 hypothetical protein [Candidatus Jingweiarchaeum tengchongense]MCW1305192.1 hypothetical protein [Candidatus Jingweiarchaeum tengchongense]